MTYKRKETIGDCTLYFGDCMDVMPTLDKFDAVVTDPPFGMCFVSSHRKEDTKHIPIANDQNTDLLKMICDYYAPHSKYVFHGWDNLPDIPKPQSVITWVKNNHSMGDLKHEHGRQTELISFYKGEEHFFPSGRPSDVIKASRTGNTLHPTEKPVGLMEVICGWTYGAILDPFMGSGTTGVACAKMGRTFTGIEMEEKYFDIACKRIEEAYQQPDMFVEQEKPKSKEQRDMFI